MRRKFKALRRKFNIEYSTCAGYWVIIRKDKPFAIGGYRDRQSASNGLDKIVKDILISNKNERYGPNSF